MARDMRKELLETLGYLPYNGTPEQFYKEFKDYLKILGFKGSKLSDRKVKLAYCLRNIKESTKTKSIRISETKFRKSTLVNA